MQTLGAVCIGRKVNKNAFIVVRVASGFLIAV